MLPGPDSTKIVLKEQFLYYDDINARTAFMCVGIFPYDVPVYVPTVPDHLGVFPKLFYLP